MSKNLKTLTIVLSFVAAIVLLCVLLSMRGVKNYSDKYEGIDLNKDVVGLERSGTYKGYLKEHADAKEPQKAIAVDLYSYEGDGNISVYTNFHDEAKCLFTDTESVLTYTINVPNKKQYKEQKYQLDTGFEPFDSVNKQFGNTQTGDTGGYYSSGYIRLIYIIENSN